MRISDWSSDVCSSDLGLPGPRGRHATADVAAGVRNIHAGELRSLGQGREVGKYHRAVAGAIRRALSSARLPPESPAGPARGKARLPSLRKEVFPCSVLTEATF